MRFASKSKASASTLRLSLQGVVAFLFVASILITIPALILVRTLTNSPEEEHHHHIRANDAIDAPKSNGHSNNIPRKEEVVQSHADENWHLLNTKEEDNRGVEKANDIVPNPNVLSPPNPKQFQSYPGLTEDQSVSCGAHKARSCDQCPQGNGASWCNDHCEWRDDQCVPSSKVKNLHPDYFRITQRYAFSPVQNQNQQYVNIIMVRSPFRGKDDEDVYKFYKDDILFLGISSFEDFPLTPTNPYSAKYDGEYYLNMFPGFLHMMRDPNKYFPPKVETLFMSQSDFFLDEPQEFGQKHADDEKVYDFVYHAGDQVVEKDCTGWAGFNKNFSFAREALEVMCSPEFNVTGVILNTKNKAGTKACTIPAACHGKIVQTSFLDHSKFFGYLVKARWAFLPQICDASPRVSTQAMSLNVPLLMNRNIMGGWKYLVPG
eukprot:CAMPEP_0181136236 /NCGR_PEP_ID=MMETSP1071-20121207/33074_1 /TAXON_ID=35127 /ORGANISM="Thalassiosira sp., Strain NH16" /LENGTH=432 /DNA_ID=CAMNT_0023222929 /DNA_START=26 /DNA_END=1320 /DNA_ORIENTATION=+